MTTDLPTRSRISRVRHELKRRTLTVVERHELSPGLLRLVFTSPDLEGFTSLGFDDHIKLFFPSGGDAPVMRDYTPRRYDPQTNQLTIEFALHDPAGPATAWAQTAKIGDELQIGGPRGSFIVEDSFDWYVLVGDEAALPAIGRRLVELRPGVPVYAFVSVPSAGHQVSLSTRADLHLQWVEGSGAEALVAAVRSAGLPAGEGYVWVAAEASAARALRGVFVDELGQPGDLIKAAAYWSEGAPGVHEVIDPVRSDAPAH